MIHVERIIQQSKESLKIINPKLYIISFKLQIFLVIIIKDLGSRYSAT